MNYLSRVSNRLLLAGLRNATCLKKKVKNWKKKIKELEDE
ncbi:hypothetical protein Javan308_0022 [Streptococcus phage Javan308]|nr:hypothetical protein Javan308_0022 [Streptococcus phage Javan308]